MSEDEFVNRYIDLRSDTVTRPTSEMRKAMAHADVGDDGRVLPDGNYGDPTVRELEERVAEFLGKPSALLIASGTQANMIAFSTWCARGDRVATGKTSHILQREHGLFDPQVLGLKSRAVPDPLGVLDLPEARASRPALICMENAHNASGGQAWHPDLVSNPLPSVGQPAPVHLDGARLVNAAVSLDVAAARVAAVGDSVMMCLSKGLGAPIGSMLAGGEQWIAEARSKRRLLGGQMRQAGVIAAAGLVGLKNARETAMGDHQRARTLARALAELPGLQTDPNMPVATNIVHLDVSGGPTERARLVDMAASQGVLLGTRSEQCIRLVTHRDIDDDAIGRTVDVIRLLLDRT